MTYKYTETGIMEIDGKDVSSVIDTDAGAFVSRRDWIARQTGTAYVDTVITGVMSPGDPTLNETGVCRYRLGNSEPVAIDCLAIQVNPRGCVAYLAGVLGLNVVITEYQEPKPAEEMQDWQQVDSKIGPPLPGQPGRFSSRFDGSPVGTVWTGRSGRRYELREVGLFKYACWFAL